MRDAKCAQMLLEAAARDLATLRSMTDAAPDESFGFHVQQAAEKAFKAWLALLGEVYPLTHNLGDLLNLLTTRGVDVERFSTFVDYTPYAVEFRYHGVEAGVERIDRTIAIALVETLLDEVRIVQGKPEGR